MRENFYKYHQLQYFSAILESNLKYFLIWQKRERQLLSQQPLSCFNLNGANIRFDTVFSSPLSSPAQNLFCRRFWFPVSGLEGAFRFTNRLPFLVTGLLLYFFLFFLSNPSNGFERLWAHLVVFFSSSLYFAFLPCSCLRRRFLYCLFFFAFTAFVFFCFFWSFEFGS